MSTSQSSEQTLNYQWDVCLSNMVVQSGIGLGAGIVSSVLFFRRAAWPVWGGLGFGLGKSYADSNARLRTFHAIPKQLPASSTQKKD
ncbi:MICOS complex subunit mic10 [Schizosaccharomyces pombe]|uniref:MICOS complex subunit mic10 n=1 Tax=Schizosaccharomyces pombe (strain 972 / ATCC 24843) TaxID=284812 RepID=MIC10_SCHPO|nr:uncharacterized protein SPAPJ691.03 [Schizosaccharomyces pombe]Q9HFF0.1 RecName: Full=MICOS complex subunit mic10; AltName: Full=Mitochondrial inner membrane organizing system protein PJ691.03 [Schizosaccharomyces pombe 972h-]CAC14019.1 mitochondrial conserved eukaryotic protein [Schizosaccharomyces pombe]|eukprot:NP_594896.1 uncharacterized protein SPAPJ691.03 [Schizosaccharomyces pombe]